MLHAATFYSYCYIYSAFEFFANIDLALENVNYDIVYVISELMVSRALPYTIYPAI